MVFDRKETYIACLAALENLAEKHHFDIVTESVEYNKNIDDIDKLN